MAWERRGLRVRPQYDGLDTVELTLQREETARLVAALDAVLDREFFAGRRRDPAAGPVDAAVSTGSGGEDPKHCRPFAARRLDALLDLIDAGVVTLGKGGEIDVEKAALNVMIDYDTLFLRVPGACETANGAPLTGDAARRLACDAGYHRIITRGRSIVLDVGTKTRTWSRAQRRAIRTRHGHQCAVLACGARITQIHHVVPVECGGETNVDAGIPLCAWHHRLVHEGGWTVTYDVSSGLTTLLSPDGSRAIASPPYDPAPWRRGPAAA